MSETTWTRTKPSLRCPTPTCVTARPQGPTSRASEPRSTGRSAGAARPALDRRPWLARRPTGLQLVLQRPEHPLRPQRPAANLAARRSRAERAAGRRVAAQVVVHDHAVAVRL